MPWESKVTKPTCQGKLKSHKALLSDYEEIIVNTPFFQALLLGVWVVARGGIGEVTLDSHENDFSDFTRFLGPPD